ncbi:S8 family peptidase [Arenibaculum pallidiluteum]|uniref:S8 family peptidase n=1 Tax=Arenibaculum pallidiluteum TaxID=2812559 RepID=UPI001A96B615|nr:S8 family serine peptidase [Arenibaculum pallidiluteum]
MSTDFVANSLNMLDDVEIVRRVAPKGVGVLGTFGAGGGSSMPEVIVARMPAERGLELLSTAGPTIVVEEDRLLHHSDFPEMPELLQPQFLAMPGVGTDIQFRVVGEGGKPLGDAMVYVYGRGFPAQGKTGPNGQVSITLFGTSLEAVTAIYVKPACNHWDRYLSAPELNEGVNTIQLRELSQAWPEFPKQRLVNWGQKLMHLEQMAESARGRGVKIGIIDSGCDITHPQLDHIASGLDFTGGDRERGWTTDTYAHGTHCAGIIAASSKNMPGILGFAPDAEVHAFKVFPGGRFSDLIDALDECIQRRIDVVNLSLGSDAVSELVARKIEEARQHGVACIVAAGNSGQQVQFPARLPGVLAVGALGRMGEFPEDSFHATTVLQGGLAPDGTFIAKFSCNGPEIAVSAPGVAVVSTVPGGYAALDGTSMAAPHVTGLAALILAHHPAFQGGLKARNAQRVEALFQVIAQSCVNPFPGAPTYVGAGLPDLSHVPQQAQPAAVAPAAVAFGGRPIGTSLGSLAPAGFGAGFGQQVAWGATQQTVAPFMVNQALVQQLRAAGLL